MKNMYKEQFKREKKAKIYDDDSPALKDWKIRNNQKIARRKRERLEEMIERQRLKGEL
jgi:hypothetical protein